MFDLNQGVLYHVTLSMLVPLLQAQAGWAVMLSSSLAGAWRSAWSSTRLLTPQQPKRDGTGRETALLGSRRVTMQESRCSLGLMCWGLWFFWTCLWAQVRVWLLLGKVLAQNQHLVQAAWAWSNKKKDQGVPGVWGGPCMPVTVQPAQMRAAGASQKLGLQPVLVMKRWTLQMPCATLLWSLPGWVAMPPQLGLLLHWDLPLCDSAIQPSRSVELSTSASQC